MQQSREPLSHFSIPLTFPLKKGKKFQIDPHLLSFDILSSSPTVHSNVHSIETISGLGMWLSWYSACPACMKPWVRSPASHELSEGTYTCNSTILEVEAAGSRFQDFTSPQPEWPSSRNKHQASRMTYQGKVLAIKPHTLSSTPGPTSTLTAAENHFIEASWST